MPLDYSTFLRAADPEDVLPGHECGLLASTPESRIETRRRSVPRRWLPRVSGAEVVGVDLTLACAANAEAGPRQYLQPI
jgi:hypothetical protein